MPRPGDPKHEASRRSSNPPPPPQAAHAEQAAELLRVSRRHIRLPAWVLIPGLSLLALSVGSGVVLWSGVGQGEWTAPGDGSTGVSRAAWVAWHGGISPAVSLFLGYLLAQHVRVGWKHRLSRWSGLTLMVALAGLVVSGAGLTYLGDAAGRALCEVLHRGCGVVLPLALVGHWIDAKRTLRKLQE